MSFDTSAHPTGINPDTEPPNLQLRYLSEELAWMIEGSTFEQRWKTATGIFELISSYFSNLENNFRRNSAEEHSDFDNRPDIFKLFSDQQEQGMALELPDIYHIDK